MKKDLTELVFILDRSGSMNGLESDTIGGYNSMLDKQRKLAGECVITTVLFSGSSELLHDRIDIRAIRPLTEQDYSVDGSTALLDAIGTAISKTDTAQHNTLEEFRAERVMFVIITDGMENASRQYSVRQIREMIEHQQRSHGWEFIFLGANMDAVKTAGAFGISADHAADYVPDAAGTELNFNVMSNAVAAFRAGRRSAANELDRIREDRVRRGG